MYPGPMFLKADEFENVQALASGLTTRTRVEPLYS